MTTQELAYKIRLNTIEMVNRGKSSHIGSVFSIADIVAVLYNEIMRFNPEDPKWIERDRFILSKGHAGAAIYAVLSEKGFFPKEMLKNYYQNGSIFSGHVSHKGIPGVELSTGSLGHGLSIATGIAFTAKLDNKGFKTFTILSDGECDEGTTWEAAMFAAHHKLNNLIAIIDYNKIQSIDSVQDTLELEPFADKWKSFGWQVQETDGHNINELTKTLQNLISSGEPKPKCLIAHTTKGKGISFMENTVLWHYRSPQGEEYTKALEELEKNYANCVY